MFEKRKQVREFTIRACFCLICFVDVIYKTNIDMSLILLQLIAKNKVMESPIMAYNVRLEGYTTAVQAAPNRLSAVQPLANKHLYRMKRWYPGDKVAKGRN